MNIKDMKYIITSKEYDFLRNDERLKDNIILLTTGGSYAYGTNIETTEHTSDFDLRGIHLPSKREILTMNVSDKPYENRELDVVIYPLKQIVNLLSNCNPNTIELLGTKDEHLFYCSKAGKILRDNVNVFLSQKAYASFGGYAIQQLRRLENALARDSYPQKEKEKHIAKSIEKQMMTFNDRYKEEANINIYTSPSNKEGFEEEIMVDINLKNYPLRDLKGMLSEMSQVVRDYDKLNHRNSKKDELHLLKHAMHLIRLLKMGKEVLAGEGINTYREKDRELLLDIRRGVYSYEEIFKMVNTFEEEFNNAYKNTTLPKVPDYDKIDDLVVEILSIML